MYGDFDVNRTAAGRIAIACCSALTVYALGRTVARQVGWPSALLAAALYATWPQAVMAERAVMLEPLLNLLGVAVARSDRETKRACFEPRVAGPDAHGEWWAAAWVLAALVTAPNRSRAFALRISATASHFLCQATAPAPAAAARS